MKYIMFSRCYPAYHPRKGQSTFFAEKVLAALAELADIIPLFKIPDEFTNWDWHKYYNAFPKWHTIRAGTRFKKGEQFSPRVWTGAPYKSKQQAFADPITITDVWDVKIENEGCQFNVLTPSVGVSGYENVLPLSVVAKNDGLLIRDFEDWFNPNTRKNRSFTGQIICWNPKINYASLSQSLHQ